MWFLWSNLDLDFIDSIIGVSCAVLWFCNIRLLMEFRVHVWDMAYVAGES